MRSIISSIIALITLILAVFGIGEVKDTNQFQNKIWMAAVSDSAYLSEISIPGTHDTCALYEPIEPCAKCQDYTLKDQLDMGVRFIDIRGAVLGSKIFCVHGPIYQAQNLDEVLKTCYDFLKSNPSETIIFSLKEDLTVVKKPFKDVAQEYIKKGGDMWFTENRIPTLGEVRGKIVLINRFDSSCELGIKTSGWRDNASFTIENPDFNINIQDYYQITSVEDEWAQAEKLFNDCKNCESSQRKSNMYINFLSGYLGKLPDQVTVADGMNRHFTQYFENAEKGCYGIVLFDFVTQEYCDTVISTNFDV